MGETRGGSVQWRGLGCCRPGAHANTPLFPLWARSYIVLWIALSAAVILINKYVLAVSGFPFPIALTLTHMGFCSSLAFVLIKLGVSDTAHMDSSTYMRWVSYWCKHMGLMDNATFGTSPSPSGTHMCRAHTTCAGVYCQSPLYSLERCGWVTQLTCTSAWPSSR